MTNKHLLTYTAFRSPVALLIWQHCVALVCTLGVARWRGTADAQFDARVARRWLPVNLLFVAMLLSGSLALRHLSVAIVTCFKNTTTIVIAAFEAVASRRAPSAAVVAAAALMLGGSLVAGWEDLEFSAVGDFWMVVNVAASAAYVLYCRRVMARLRLRSLHMVFMNNLLSLPLLLTLAALWSPAEVAQLPAALAHDAARDAPPLLQRPLPMTALLLGNGALAYLLSTASLWAMGATSGTTYSIVGSVIKIPTTVISVYLYHTPFTRNGGISLAASLVGGILYAYARAVENRRAQQDAARIKGI